MAHRRAGLKTTYPFLCSDVVLDGSTATPCSIASEFSVFVLQLFHERRPQSQALDVVRVVEVLDELLKVVECGYPVLQFCLLVLNDLHTFLHLFFRASNNKVTR